MNMTPVPNAPMDMKASLVWEVKFALGRTASRRCRSQTLSNQTLTSGPSFSSARYERSPCQPWVRGMSKDSMLAVNRSRARQAVAS